MAGDDPFGRLVGYPDTIPGPTTATQRVVQRSPCSGTPSTPPTGCRANPGCRGRERRAGRGAVYGKRFSPLLASTPIADLDGQATTSLDCIFASGRRGFGGMASVAEIGASSVSQTRGMLRRATTSDVPRPDQRRLRLEVN